MPTSGLRHRAGRPYQAGLGECYDVTTNEYLCSINYHANVLCMISVISGVPAVASNRRGHGNWLSNTRGRSVKA